MEVREKLIIQVNGFPKLPGVYLMRDSAGEVIYVGKAKDLRARVRTYFAGGDGRSQIEFLLKRVEALDKIVTENEEQAFILERDLISRYKPRYNIKLKDDKAFLSIRLDENAEWPRLELVRKVAGDGARYFGPYSFSYELKTLLEIIKRVIPLRTCTNTVFYNRQRPCLEYQIKRCAGPCCLALDKVLYRQWVQQAIAILEGKTTALEKQLEEQMERASEALRFEDAALLRDRLETLRSFKSGARLISSHGEDRDVVALYREERLLAVAVLLVRSGRVSDSINFAFSEVSISDGEVLESVLEQFYQSGREIPDEIVLPFEFENISFVRDALQKRRGERIEFSVPQRGIKARLLGLAELNAKQHFLAKYDSEARYMELAQTLAKKFVLRQIPRKIECVDISNFQGSDIVGAIVTFVDGVPEKSLYKKYKISVQDKADDFAAVFEVVTRRLERGQQENDLPDLLIIDGGPGQLAKALKARDELGVYLEIISLAKMRTESNVQSSAIEKVPERIYSEGVKEAVLLEDGAELTRFFQRIRDETHRFVITFHRKTRSKRVFSSKLDAIGGLGPDRKRRLLKEFGSVVAIGRAEAEQVAKAGRMPLSLAKKVLDALN